MTFALPHLLWLLLLPSALLTWEILRARRLAEFNHPKILRAEAGLRSVSLSEDASPAPLASRRRYLLCAGAALGIVALARPQWGRLDEPVFDQSRDIVIALDLSRSMLSPDVKPSRLERSKLLIQALLDRLKGERVGLIIFSGTAFLQSPVSADYEILREFLPALGPDYLPEGGTNYRQLIDASIEAFGDGSAADRYLIILSDGEATDDNWRDRVPELARRRIRVIGLGVGTAKGAMIPDGTGGFMKDTNGAVVLSKLESATLRELADATHGAYRDASEWVDLAKVLEETVGEGRKGRFVEHNAVRHAERFQWALAQALACLVASFWLEFPVRPKSRDIRLSPPASPKPKAALAAATVLAAALALFAAARASAAEADQAAGLSKMVARLSAQDHCSAQDWAELGNETLRWGQHLKSASQAVPEGPVRDALRAVDLGSAADPKASDWPRIRSELEELLKTSEQKNADSQNQEQKQNEDRDKQKDQQQNQKQDQNESQGEKAPPTQSGKQQQQNEPGSPQQQKPGSSRQQERQDAFGDMGKPPVPTPERREPQEAMQKVGGVKKDEPNDPARENPELAVPLEKLERLKSQDSPAELFELLRRGEPLPTPTDTGKNW